MAIAALGFSYNQIRVRSRFQVRKKIPQKIRARSNDQIKCWLTGLGREAGFRLPHTCRKIITHQNNHSILPLRILTMATTCAIHRSFVVTMFRVMAEKQLFLTIFENHFIKNRRLDGRLYRFSTKKSLLTTVIKPSKPTLTQLSQPTSLISPI